MLTTAPPTGLLRAVARPPWAAQIAWTMARPRPALLVVPAPAAVWSAEPLEGVRKERVREAGTVVADLDAQVGALFPGRDHDDRPGRREASRVREQVVDGLADAVGVHVKPGLLPGHRRGR